MLINLGSTEGAVVCGCKVLSVLLPEHQRWHETRPQTVETAWAGLREAQGETGCLGDPCYWGLNIWAEHGDSIFSLIAEEHCSQDPAVRFCGVPQAAGRPRQSRLRAAASGSIY